MLPLIGLVLDLIGAFALTRGLFRHSVPLVTGYRRHPHDAAEDHAYGVVGFIFLASGFTCQALPSLGATWNATACEARLAAIITLVGGSILAYVGWGLAYVVLVRRELRHANAKWPDLAQSATWQPRLRKFWNHDFESVKTD